MRKKQVYYGLFELFKNFQLKFEPTIGLFSTDQKRFVSSEDILIENVTKIGYFNAIQLTGKYSDNFRLWPILKLVQHRKIQEIKGPSGFLYRKYRKTLEPRGNFFI